MKKRLCALALCLLLVLTALPFAACAEEPAPAQPELTLAAELSGSILTVTVGIKNNPGIAGFDLALHFNSAALTPKAAPSPVGDWEYTDTNYNAQFSGDTLKAVGVKQTNMTGDGTLFTAAFDVANGGGSYGLSVGGTACSQTVDALIELQTVYVDEFKLQSCSRTANGVTAVIASYGSGFSGDAKAIVSRYRDGKFCGCTLQSVAIAQNGVTNLSISCAPGSNETVKLILTDASFRPIYPEAINVPVPQ